MFTEKWTRASVFATVTKPEVNPGIPGPVGVPSVGIVIRSYQGDARMLRSHSLSSFEAFLDPTEVSVTILLDEESPRDHELGNCLNVVRPLYTVKYEPFPSTERLLFPEKGGHGIGYTRQIWSNFYGDEQTNASIVCLMDADATLSRRFVPESVLDSTGTKIVVRVWKGNRYPMDREVLGISEGVWAANSQDGMETNLFPFCYWRDTFKAMRDFVSNLHAESFDRVFMRYSANHYASQFGILDSYAYFFERDRYAFHHLDREEEAVPHIGLHSAHFPYSLPALTVACCVQLNPKNFTQMCDIRSFMVGTYIFGAWEKPLADQDQSIAERWHTTEVSWFNRSAHRVSKNERVAQLMTLSCEEAVRGKVNDGCECCGMNSAPRSHKVGAVELWEERLRNQKPSVVGGLLHAYHTENLQQWIKWNNSMVSNAA